MVSLSSRRAISACNLVCKENAGKSETCRQNHKFIRAQVEVPVHPTPKIRTEELLPRRDYRVARLRCGGEDRGVSVVGGRQKSETGRFGSAFTPAFARLPQRVNSPGTPIQSGSAFGALFYGTAEAVPFRFDGYAEIRWRRSHISETRCGAPGLFLYLVLFGVSGCVCRIRRHDFES